MSCYIVKKGPKRCTNNHRSEQYGASFGMNRSRPLRKKKSLTLLFLESYVINTRTVQNLARPNDLWVGAYKQHPNTRPDPLSPSEEIQQNQLTRLGSLKTKVVEHDSH